MSAGSRLERLALRNVRCFRDTEVKLDPHLTVVIGENGSGKTTIVEALASLSSGEHEGLPFFPLARKARSGSGEIALYGAGSKRPAARWRPGARDASNRRLPELHFLLAYGRYRRVFFPEDSAFEPGPFRPEIELDALARRAFESRTTTVFRPDNHLLRDLSRYLRILHFGSQSDRRLATIWRHLDESLAGLGQGIEGIVMERTPRGDVPRIVRNGVSLELRELSDGYQAILVIIFDLMLRYAYLFPLLEDPLQGEATVVIDEPKSLFPSLAYEWDNYFLGCGGCNGAKRDKWPAGGGCYVRPDEEDPSGLFIFYEDGTVEAVVPGSAAEVTLTDFDMRRGWLSDQRVQEIEEALSELRSLVEEAGLTLEVRERLARGVLVRRGDPKGRYSVAVMQCLRRFCEEHLPGALR